MASFEILKTDDVNEALRLWHGGEVTHWPLAHLRLGRNLINQEESFSSLAEAGASAQNRAILSLGLNDLKKIAPEAEELLRSRYEHRRDVMAVANSLNVAESSIYYRQRQAVNQLTDILINLEQQAGEDWHEKMAARLDIQTYAQLIGVDDSRKTLINVLMNPTDHFIVALDGLGGIGKTALADRVTRDLLKTTRFDEIAWITAKHTHLSTLGRLQIESGRPALTFPMLVDKLGVQFEIQGNETFSQLQRQRKVRQYLRERACLIVIDNLETVADYHNLLPELRKLQNPSKFLLTSRIRLLDEAGVYSTSLNELDAHSAFELLRFEAERTGFAGLANMNDSELNRIYDVVGGNPLALKLIVGQLRFHSLPYVLEKLTHSESRATEAGIFDYIYREIWESLLEQSKMVLLTLTQAGESGFSMSHIADVSNLSERVVSTNLEKLILLSLVDLTGSIIDRRYRLHRLTEVFLLNMFSEK